MGLFEDIWNWMRSKVQGLINASLTSFKTWVRNTVNAIVSGIQKVYYDFSKYITNVYNTFNDWITNVYNTFNTFVTNVYKTYNSFITNVNNTYNDFITNVTKVYNQYVTNKTYQTIQYITNVIGVLDPLGFLKDPRGYITGVWNLLINPWAHGIVKSFYEGFEEGLAE